MAKTIILGLLVAFMATALTSYLTAVSWLKKKGVRIQLFFIGLYLPKNLQQYKIMTEQETGRVGLPFILFMISINLALVLLLLWVFL